MKANNISKDIDVSVITPFYKGNAYLEKLFQCIRKNAENAPKITIELVLVNDSPQYKLQYNKKWVQKFQLKVIHNPANSGIQQSRINGIRAASGHFVIMLDQDDILHENAICSQMKSIKDNDIVVGNGFDENPVSNGKIYKSINQQKHVQDLHYYYLVGNMIVSPGQCMIKKKIIPNEWCMYPVKNNGSDDLLLWILLLKKEARWTINPDVLYRHVFTGNNISSDLNRMISSTNEVIDLLKHLNLISPAEINLINRRIKMREIYEGKSIGKKIFAYLKYPDIAIELIKSKFK